MTWSSKLDVNVRSRRRTNLSRGRHRLAAEPEFVGSGSRCVTQVALSAHATFESFNFDIAALLFRAVRLFGTHAIVPEVGTPLACLLGEQS